MNSVKGIRMIVAHTSARGIGLNGTIPWNIPEDIQRFKKLTMGNIVVMGRATYESIPDKYRPLSGRINIVMSRRTGTDISGILYYCNSTESVFERIYDIHKTSVKDVDIIGGTDIYSQWLPHTSIVEVTNVYGNYECDRFFPDYTIDFERVWNSEPSLSKSGMMYHYERWLRKSGE